LNIIIIHQELINSILNNKRINKYMDTTWISIFIILLITYLYFSFFKKPSTSDKYINLIPNLFYFLAIVITQLVINSLYIMNKCGMAAGKSFGIGFFITLVPWTLIFGILIIILMVFPNIKSCFSNVVGYFWVSGRANDLLSEILMDSKINESINSSGISDKQKYEKAAETIIKIVGNKSILINEITPYNFDEMWNLFKPLIKSNMDTDDNRQKLLNLVIEKDNWGESMWYIYTALLVISIVSYQLSTKACVKDISVMKAEHDAYLKKEEELNKQKELSTSTIYTLGT